MTILEARRIFKIAQDCIDACLYIESLEFDDSVDDKFAVAHRLAKQATQGGLIMYEPDEGGAGDE